MVGHVLKERLCLPKTCRSLLTRAQRMLDSMFQSQFGGDHPPPALIEETWRRLLHEASAPLEKTPFPKGFIIAVLYMLHIESHFQDRKPKDRHPRHPERVVISPERRELCKSFGFWARCQCGNSCGRRWNFANKVGISKGGWPNHFCAVAMAIAEGRGGTPWLETRVKWERGED